MNLKLHSALFIVLLVAGVVHAGPGYGQYVSGELVCKMEPGYSIDSVFALFGTPVKGELSQIQCHLLAVPSGQNTDILADLIDALDIVAYCRPNYFLSIPEGLQRSSPFVDQQSLGDFGTQSAALELGLTSTHELSVGAGVRIGVIDGGINRAHPEFYDHQDHIFLRHDFVDSDSLPLDEPGGEGSGHGTLAAGILKLVAPSADLYIYRALDTSGRGDGFHLAEAILMAIQDGCQVINLSLGMLGMHEAVDDALRLTRQNDILVLAAAGNDSSSIGALFPYPASRDFCMAVLAVDSSGRKADFSNFGVKSDICAPGTNIYGPYLENEYVWWSGTSFSTPFVTGLAALVLSARPELTRSQVDELICISAADIDLQNPEYVGLIGAGMLNPLQTVESALAAVPGDLNGDLTTDITDITLLSFYLFQNSRQVSNWSDYNGDGKIDIVDLTSIVTHLYQF